MKKIAFTLLNGHHSTPIFSLITKRIAFTMAEILLSLTIIGVVAAITLPSLTGNINERTWNTQRKALYSRISQAIALMPHLNGYYTSLSQTGDEYNKYVSATNATETFLTKGLSKVYKMNNICDVNNLADCGIPKEIIPYGGSSKIPLSNLKTLSSLDSWFSATNCGNIAIETNAGAFETANGESILVHYNPICSNPHSEDGSSTTRKLCVNMIYDLNGKKGPNTIGKDVGVISVFYPYDSEIVAPVPVNTNTPGKYNRSQAINICKNQDDDARLPNMQELSSISLNRKFFNVDENAYYWSSSSSSNGYYWKVAMWGYTTLSTPSSTDSVRCIKRI